MGTTARSRFPPQFIDVGPSLLSSRSIPLPDCNKVSKGQAEQYSVAVVVVEIWSDQ